MKQIAGGSPILGLWGMGRGKDKMRNGGRKNIEYRMMNILGDTPRRVF